jgi:hypothetical protein
LTGAYIPRAATRRDRLVGSHRNRSPRPVSPLQGGEYEILGVARHSETQDWYVVYRPLYGDGGMWVRPLAMFAERVIHDGHERPRFEYLGPTGSA